MELSPDPPLSRIGFSLLPSSHSGRRILEGTPLFRYRFDRISPSPPARTSVPAFPESTIPVPAPMAPHAFETACILIPAPFEFYKHFFRYAKSSVFLDLLFPLCIIALSHCITSISRHSPISLVRLYYPSAFSTNILSRQSHMRPFRPCTNLCSSSLHLEVLGS